MKDVVYVIENALEEKTMDYLRKECNFLTILREKYDPLEVGASIDPLEEVNLPEDSIARINADEYFRLRWNNTSSKLSFDEKARIQETITSSLPSTLTKTVPSLADKSMLYLFNEHYIVKSPNSEVAFRWHCDAEEQLMAIPEAHRPVYWSIWCPLDDCDEKNGTLHIPDDVAVEYLSYHPDESSLITSTSDSSGMKRKRNVSCSNVLDNDYDGLPIIAAAGSIVIFSSRTWHRSGMNSSCLPRRVFYVQYSDDMICPLQRKDGLECPAIVETAANIDHDEEKSKNAASPLNLFIPCRIALM